ncbi:MAG: hypothetical protein ACE141_09900 [Bryobacteraceae bacterium]
MTRWHWRLRRMLRGTRHPDFHMLFLWQENGAAKGEMEWVGAHVRGCEKCRRQVERVRSVQERTSAALDGPEIPGAWERGEERLLGVLRDEEMVKAVSERLQRGREIRMATGLAPYFGAYPMSLLERSLAGGPPFGVQARRLAEAFLGRKATEVLISCSEQLWDAAGEGG